jgi:TolB-like protein
MKIMSVMKFFSVASIFFFLSSCAYKLSNRVDTLPGGVKTIYVPVFRNLSPEPGVEVFFTDSMKSEILRSGYATIQNSEGESDAVLVGTILSVDIITDESVTEASKTQFLPSGTVLSSNVKVTVTTRIVLRRKLSTDTLWSSEFTQSRNYVPPQVTLPVLNSANNLYNESAKRQTLSVLSNELMQLAFDRLVDNF